MDRERLSPQSPNARFNLSVEFRSIALLGVFYSVELLHAIESDDTSLLLWIVSGRALPRRTCSSHAHLDNACLHLTRLRNLKPGDFGRQ